MHFLVPVIIFVAVAAIVFGISEFITQRSKSGGVANRLGTITGSFTPEQLAPGYIATLQQAADALPPGERTDILPTVTEYLSSSNYGKALRLQLHQAGLRLKPSEFVALTAVGVVGMAAIGLFMTKQLVMVIIMGAVGFAVPYSILKFKQGERTQKFDAQLPDALTLIASSLRTGYSFLHSCEMVIGEMSAPISEEFAWVQGEVKLGVPMEQALQRMVARVKSYDFDLVVTAVSIQLQVGGNLAEILDTISNTIRERVRIKREIAALTAEGKLSGIIVFLMPIFMALFLSLKSPGYFDPMLNDPSGPPMMIGTAVMMCTGGLIIRKMVDIDV
jgi:tight adherence protein B